MHLDFLAPYRGVQYHLNEHCGRNPKNLKELFNKKKTLASKQCDREGFWYTKTKIWNFTASVTIFD